VEIARVQCATHPQSPGVAVCVSCSAVVCAECTTRLQGRNFCAACLQLRAGPDHREISPTSSAGVRRLLAVLVPMSTAVLFSAVALLGYLLHWLA